MSSPRSIRAQPARRPLRVAFPGVFERDNNIILQALDTRFAVREDADPELVFCGERVDPVTGGFDPRAVTVHLPVEVHWPPLHRFDAVLGFLKLSHPRYLRLSNYAMNVAPGALIKDAGFAERVLAEPRDFASFLVSNGNAHRTWTRIAFFERLHARRRVASGGPFRNNIGHTVPRGVAATVDFIRRHRFHLAFENKRWPGYVSEKLPLAMAAGAIPLYWGTRDAARDFNPGSFVDLGRFASIDDGVAHVLELADDRDALHRLLAAPWLHGNRPGPAYSLERLADFLGRALAAGPQRRYRSATPFFYKRAELLAGRLDTWAQRLGD